MATSTKTLNAPALSPDETGVLERGRDVVCMGSRIVGSVKSVILVALKVPVQSVYMS